MKLLADKQRWKISFEELGGYELLDMTCSGLFLPQMCPNNEVSLCSKRKIELLTTHTISKDNQILDAATYLMTEVRSTSCELGPEKGSGKHFHRFLQRPQS